MRLISTLWEFIYHTGAYFIATYLFLWFMIGTWPHVRRSIGILMVLTFGCSFMVGAASFVALSPIWPIILIAACLGSGLAVILIVCQYRASRSQPEVIHPTDEEKDMLQEYRSVEKLTLREFAGWQYPLRHTQESWWNPEGRYGAWLSIIFWSFYFITSGIISRWNFGIHIQFIVYCVLIIICIIIFFLYQWIVNLLAYRIYLRQEDLRKSDRSN